MSRTKINVSAVIDATSQINSAKTYISSAKSSFTQTKNSIDGKIQSRSNIRNRLDTVQRQLSNIDGKIGRIRSTVQSGANQYRATDNRVKNFKKEIKGDVSGFSGGSLSANWSLWFNTTNVLRKLLKNTKSYKALEAINANILRIKSLILKYKEEYLSDKDIREQFDLGRCVVIAAQAVTSIYEKTINDTDYTPNVSTSSNTNSITVNESENVNTDVQTQIDTTEISEKLKTYTYGDKEFTVVKGLNQKYCYNQNDYDKFWSSKYNDNVGCTATSEAIAYSIYHDEAVSPNDMGWTSGGATWNHSKIIEGTKNNSASETYQTIYEYVNEGIPVMFRVRNPQKRNYGHHLTAVGIRDGADPNNLGPQDLLIVDPYKGKIETLADYTQQSGSKNTIVDNPEWSLSIPI